jgi:polar amino acid transport system substrate-binding protein
MTAHALESDREKSRQAGMQEHLTKPIDPKQLYASLVKWVRWGKQSAAESAQPGAAAPAGFGDMPGLSVQNTLRNLGGNEAVYKKLLKRFVENYENLPQDLHEALAAGNQQLVVRLAHTVKGVAANLGATSLASVAGDLEKNLATDREHAALLAQMRDVLRQTIQSMRALIEVSPEPDGAVVGQGMSEEGQVEVIAFLRLAPERMNSDWTSVQQQVKELEKLLGHSATASAYAALVLAVDDFDVDAVRAQAEKIIAQLQGAQG